MALNCAKAGACDCDCHMCQYGSHDQCSYYKHQDGCHKCCTAPPKGTK